MDRLLKMSVLLDRAGIASSMSEECCHGTSLSNVYIAGQQEIVKLKVLELHVLLSKQLPATAETEWSDWPECKCRMCFSVLKPYL